MLVLGINGSPRIKGNTDIILEKALEGAKKAGVQTEKIILNKLNMHPCQECEVVKDDGTCKVEDDFQALYRKIMASDGVILATPIFFGSLSAQVKTMIDRFQCAWRYKYVLKKPPLKKIVPGIFICVEASKRSDFQENAKSIARNFFATAEIKYKGELLCQGIEGKGDILKHPDMLERAFRIGERIL